MTERHPPSIQRSPPVRQYENYHPAELGKLDIGASFLLVIYPDIVYDGKVLHVSNCSVHVSYSEINKKESKVRFSTSEWALGTYVIVKGNGNVRTEAVRGKSMLEGVPKEPVRSSPRLVRLPPARGTRVVESAEDIRQRKRRVEQLRRCLRKKFALKSESQVSATTG